MDSVAESSKNRKRLREEEQQQEEIEAEETISNDQTLSLGKISFFPYIFMIFSIEIIFDSPSFVISAYEVDSLTFSDTVVAFRTMRAQFPHIDKVNRPPCFLFFLI